MPSKLKSETARINGAKSRGPKSAETREKSSRNSLQHGLTAASTIVLDCESPEEFKKFEARYIAMHQPANAAELDLVEQMIANQWRIRRARTMETGLVDCEMAVKRSEVLKKFPNADTVVHMAQACRSLADDSRSLALLSRYESRHQRTYERAYKTLRELQQARKSEEQAAVLRAGSQPAPRRSGQPAAIDDRPSTASMVPAKPLKTYTESPEIKEDETDPTQRPGNGTTALGPDPDPDPSAG